MTRQHHVQQLGLRDHRVLAMGNTGASSITPAMEALQQQNVALAQNLTDADPAIDQRRHIWHLSL